MLSDSGSEVQFGDITKLGRFIADTKESKLKCRQIGVLPNFILRDKLDKIGAIHPYSRNKKSILDPFNLK